MKSEINDSGKHLYTLLPGERFATSEDCVIMTVAGACGVVCLYDSKKMIGGMGSFIVPGKIDSGKLAHDEVSGRGIVEMEFLIGEIVKLGGNRKNLSASVFGAGLTGDDDGLAGVIDGNIRFFKEYFALEKIPVSVSDLGGRVRRKIQFNVADGTTECDIVLSENEFADIAGRERDYINRTLHSGTSFGEVIFFDSTAYETLIGLIPDIIYRIDHNGIFTYLSESVYKLGYEPAELIGKHYSVLMHPDDLKKVQSSLVLPELAGKKTDPASTPRLFDERRTGRRITRDLRVRLVCKKNGGGPVMHPRGEVICTGHYEASENGRRYLGTIGIIRDVTEVVSAQKVLAKTEQFYKNLINNSLDIFTILSTDGTILYVSNSVKRITGLTPDELIGENIISRTDEEDVGLINGVLRPAALWPQGSSLVEHRFLHRENRWVTLESSIFRISDNDLHTVLLVFYSRDISERKNAENRLRAALQEKEVLLKEIHHRVKNNLQIITSLLNLQASRVNSDTVLNHLRDSQNRIRAIALIHEKLYQSDDLAHVDFAEYIKTILDELMKIYSSGVRRIACEISVTCGVLALDKAIPCGLLVNEVVANSLKHAFPPEFCGNPEIRVSMREVDKGRIRLEIADNGVGIPASLNIDEIETLGLLLVKILTRDQLRGALAVERCEGTLVRIEFSAE